MPTSQCSVHKGGLVCPVPLRPWRGEGSRGRRRYAGRRATGRAEEPMSAPAAAPAAQPTGASPGKAVVPDDEFSLAKVRGPGYLCFSEHGRDTLAVAAPSDRVP